MLPLDQVIEAVEAEGARLRAEFYAPHGPRGQRGSCPIDTEIEERLREALLALVSCRFIGEETAAGPPGEGDVWIVDPHDGTFEFTSGRRGSAISVGLLSGGVPVLGVVHAPDAPDRGPDTIAWAQGCGPIRRNGAPLRTDLSRQGLTAGSLLWATASAAQKPATWSRAAAPGRYVAMPSIAYRLARVAAGDGVATMSAHGLAEYDVAAGLALIRAANGVMLDAEAREVALSGQPGARLSGCYAGAPRAARVLAAFDWQALEAEPRSEPRVTLPFPRQQPAESLSRLQGYLLSRLMADAREGTQLIVRARAFLREGGDSGWLALARNAPRREDIAPEAILDVLARRPADQPMDAWSDDILELAEALLLKCQPAATRSRTPPIP